MQVTHTIVAVLVLCIFHVCLGRMPPKSCMSKYRENFIQCLRNTETTQDCVAQLKHAMQYKCRMDPSKYLKYEINSILSDIMSQCMMKPMLRIAGAFENRKVQCMTERNTMTKKNFRASVHNADSY